MLAVPIALLYTCRSEENLVCTDANTYKIAQGAKDYFYFKEGSWWVYREKQSGQKDSIWAYRNQTYTDNQYRTKLECKCGNGKCVQYGDVEFQDSAYNTQLNDDLLFSYALRVGLYSQKTEISEWGKGEYFYSNRVRMEFSNSGEPSIPSVNNPFFEVLDSVTVLGKTYRDIFHTYYAPKKDVSDWLNEAWYAKNFHLVKYIKSDGTTWELAKSNIVQ